MTINSHDASMDPPSPKVDSPIKTPEKPDLPPAKKQLSSAQRHHWQGRGKKPDRASSPKVKPKLNRRRSLQDSRRDPHRSKKQATQK